MNMSAIEEMAVARIEGGRERGGPCLLGWGPDEGIWEDVAHTVPPRRE